MSRDERVLLTSFDFAGRVEFGDDDRHEIKPPESKAGTKARSP
jgi:hypothetical protein